MKISVRLEGGLGDHLLSNRFIPAILEEYPNAKVTAFSDTEGNSFQKECIEILYPHFYEDIKIIPHKKYKEFWVDCQFGEDNYYGALENLPDEYLQEMQSYDKFYDLHVDSLKWLDYDFDWYRYFKFFPAPAIKKDKNKDPYIIFQLHTSRSGVKNTNHYLEPWYVNKLIHTLRREHKCKIIATPELLDEYKELQGCENVEIVIGKIEDIIEEIKDASLFVGIDSGFRFIGYSFGVPAILYGIWYKRPYWCVPFHQIRWSFYPEQCFPLHHDYKEITSLAFKIMSNKAISVYPYIQDFDTEMVRRKWTINEEKSILREE
jgi:ADP-heptose:LPS heptosyltransferase